VPTVASDGWLANVPQQTKQPAVLHHRHEQDAEKRILNGGCHMEDGKTPTFSHLPFGISHQAALFSGLLA